MIDRACSFSTLSTSAGGGQLPAVAVDAPVRVASFDGIGGFDPLALDPLQVGQARAIDELVDHARRHERRRIGGDGLDRRLAKFRS